MGGTVKPLLEIDGRTILDRLVAALTPLVSDVLVSVATWDQVATSLPLVVDEVAGGGPLAGIAAALAASGRPWLVVVGGDMPDVRTDVVAALLGRARPGVDAVAPRIGGWPEPLCAVYGASCLDAARRRLAQGRLKTSGLLTDEGLTVEWIDDATLRRIDPTLQSLRNVNRPEDLA